MSLFFLLMGALFIIGAIIFRDDQIVSIVSLVGGNIILALTLILDKLDKIEKRDK